MTTHAAEFPQDAAKHIIEVALDEDLGPGAAQDVTTLATIPAEQVTTARIVARAPGVVAGLPAISLVLEAVTARLGGRSVSVQPGVDDGDRVARGDVVATLEGPTRTVLVAERTLLNLLSRLGGVATHTRRWMDALAGTGCVVLDTRKTTPGLRALEKYAVRVGGGRNKRMGLHDVAMVKDNHKIAAGSITAALRAVRSTFPDVAVEVEATSTEEAVEAVRAGARFLLLDNFTVPGLAEAVRVLRRIDDSVEIEATGGLTLDLAREVAMTGVDYLSVGALTHSSPVLDLALDIDGEDAGEGARVDG